MADSDASSQGKDKKRSFFSKLKTNSKEAKFFRKVALPNLSPASISHEASGSRPSILGRAAVRPQSDTRSHSASEVTTNTEETEPNLTVAVVADLPIRNAGQQHADMQKTPEPELYLIKELWEVAYEELKLNERKLIEEYEDKLGRDLNTALGVTTTDQRKDLMRNLLIRKIEEVKENVWKLKFGSHEIPVKDLAEPVTGIISWADDYISGALSANPYASIAWAGVSLLLPLTLNPSKQAASLAKGLDYISDLIVRSTMRELLFERRYGSKLDEESPNPELSIIRSYADTLKSLYVEILKFQATTICYLSKNGVSRLGRDIVKYYDWDGSLSDVQKRETAFCQVYEIWKDARHEEDCEKVYRQHWENMEALASISCNLVALQRSIDARQEDSSRKQLLDWLSSVDPSENYNTALRKRRDGTGEWLLQKSSDFDAWKTRHGSLLWLNGKAGSGKSILSASVIETLKSVFGSDPETALAYFYFSFSDGKKQDVVEMLSSIIKQLCCRRPDTPAAVEGLRQYITSGQRPDQTTLEKTLQAVMHGFTHVHIVIDALDECPSGQERIELLNTIGRILKTNPENLHLLLTSRREFDIEAALLSAMDDSYSGRFSSDINLSTVQGAVETDIAFHIDQEFQAEPFRSWPADVKEEAKSALTKNAGGMFQYVSCQFDELRQHKARNKILEALRNLPKGLDATYDRMLNNIAPEYQQGVASVLKWLAFSLRPLLLDELAEAFILHPEKAAPLDEDERLFQPEDVLSYLAGFIVKVPSIIDGYDYEDRSYFATRRFKDHVVQVRLAHFSIKEYLCSPRMTLEYFSTEEETSHLYLAKACLAYHLQLSDATLATEDSLTLYVLWDYAARNWTRHLEKVDREVWTDHLVMEATRALSAGSQSLLNMVRICDHEQIMSAGWERTLERLPLPIYYTSALGLYQLTKLLIDDGADVNIIEPTSQYGTALQVAALQRHEDVVRLLLGNDANVNRIAGFFGTALQAAVYSNSLEIVQLLIEYDADVNAQGGEFSNALQAAVYARNEDMVQLLIKHGDEINARGGEYGNALQVAALLSWKEGVQLLIDNGAEINAQGGTFGNALQAAAFSGGVEVVQSLLEYGAEVNAPGGEYGSALQAAAITGRKEIVHLLLQHGAKIHTQGGAYGNSLQAAIAEDNLEIADVFLSLGAKVDEPGEAWEALLLRIQKRSSEAAKAHLREFQRDPKGYIERGKEIEARARAKARARAGQGPVLTDSEED